MYLQNKEFATVPLLNSNYTSTFSVGPVAQSV
jgi:hypothetical protein